MIITVLYNGCDIRDGNGECKENKYRHCSILLNSCNQSYSNSLKCGWDLLETTEICYGKLVHFCDQMVNELDRIAINCLEKLRSQHPDHPALTSPIIPPSTPLKESRWAQDKCYQLFKCINHVLFSQVCTELCFVNSYMKEDRNAHMWSCENDGQIWENT